MKIKVTDAVKNFEGEALQLSETETFLVRDAFMQVLNQLTLEEQKVGQGAEIKAKVFALGIKMFAGKEVELTKPEAELIKERAGELSTPLVYGRICELIGDIK
jgi:hypothetical protein